MLKKLIVFITLFLLLISTGCGTIGTHISGRVYTLYPGTNADRFMLQSAMHRRDILTTSVMLVSLPLSFFGDTLTFPIDYFIRVKTDPIKDKLEDSRPR